MSRESNKKYPDEYLLKDSFWREFGIVLGVILLVCLWTSIKPEEYFFELCFCSVLGILCGFLWMRSLEYAVFNHTGLRIVHENRWGKITDEYYTEWGKIESVECRRIADAFEIIIRTYDCRGGYQKKTRLSKGQFESLAKYYSGRDDIVKRVKFFKKKRKPFEKDW